MQGIVWLAVVGCAVWVGFDASRLGFRRGRLGGGPLDMGVASYVLCTLLIWVIGFPCFLVARGRYLAMNALPPQGGIAYGYPAASAAALAMQGHPGQGHPGHAGHFLPPQHQYGQPHVPAQQPHAQQAAPTAPPQWSPDRQWWWDGTAWIPAASAPSM